jgi:hypothetical protein
MVIYLKEQWGKDRAIEDEILKLAPEVETTLEAKMKDYRHTLLVQAFDNYVVEKKLDTNISIDSIQAYGKIMSANLLNRGTIDKFIYFIKVCQFTRLDTFRHGRSTGRL